MRDSRITQISEVICNENDNLPLETPGFFPQTLSCVVMFFSKVFPTPPHGGGDCSPSHGEAAPGPGRLSAAPMWPRISLRPPTSNLVISFLGLNVHFFLAVSRAQGFFFFVRHWDENLVGYARMSHVVRFVDKQKPT